MSVVLEPSPANAGEFVAGGGAYTIGEAFFAGMAEGAELGSIAGPIGVIGGLLVGAAVVALYEAAG
jgi:L-aminopeptidase/D-esterase-like protein